MSAGGRLYTQSPTFLPLAAIDAFGIADELVNGPKTADELAAVVNAHGPSLYRLLRALATADVFIEDDQHRFANTPLSGNA